MAVAAAASGCALRETAAPTAKAAAPLADAAKSQAIMEEYNKLLTKKGVKPAELTGYINRNIGRLPKENATQLVLGFEESQKSALALLETRFYTEQVQKELQRTYKNNVDLNKLDRVSDVNVRKLLTDTREGGFKVETAEGMYFPVVDYDFYRQYREYVTADIAAYINLMAVESDRTPAKDGAIVITWDEVIARAVAQEQFLRSFGASARTDGVRMLFAKYINFMFFGANNSPLFDYEDKLMNAEAGRAYEKAVAQYPASPLLHTVDGLLRVNQDNGYRLGDEVEKYRRDAVKRLSNQYLSVKE